MTRAALNECLAQADLEGFEAEAQDAESYVSDLEAKLKAATKALRQIADYAEGNVIKYIQGVDAIACDALDLLNEEAKK